MADVVIVGGGAVGSATAYHLVSLAPALDVVVVERDPTYEFSSTLRSEGNVRIQFALAENVLMSSYCLELFSTFPADMQVGSWRPDLDPRRQGNLFFSDEAGRAATHAQIALQRSLGGEVRWMSSTEIARRWPELRSDLDGGAYGPDDGTIDPAALLHGFRRRAAHLGATYRQAVVQSLSANGGRIVGVETDAGFLEAAVVIVAAGAWSAALLRTAGIELPVEPVMRTVYLVEAPLNAASLPAVFLPSGAYAIPAGPNRFEMGWGAMPPGQPDVFAFDRAGFDELLWPELIAHLPAFDALHVTGGWRGLYAQNTFDGNALLGAWPELPGLYMATGFSGHGLQHAPAMGRHIAELVTGRAPALDLRRLRPDRASQNAAVSEDARRLI